MRTFFILLILSGCEPNSTCIFDTDCPIDQACSTAGQCEPLLRPDASTNDGSTDAELDAADASAEDAAIDSEIDAEVDAGVLGTGRVAVAIPPGRVEMSAHFGAETCVTTTVSPCVLSVCSVASSVSAGNISFRHGAADPVLLELMPTSENLYAPGDAADATGWPGDVVGTALVQSTGATVPILSHDLMIPKMLTLVEPAAAVTTLVRGGGFSASWMPIGEVGGQGWIAIDGVRDAQSFTLACTYDPSMTTAAVPAMATMGLSVGPARLRVGTIHFVDDTRDRWNIRYESVRLATSPAGTASWAINIVDPS